VVAAGVALAGASEALARGAEASAATDGAALYRRACAACHGEDGRGVPRERVGFAEPLPDFTDCSFATREPDEDWLAITHGGGPARGFVPMMAAFGEALSEGELRLALGHVRTFCPDGRWPRGELNLPRALFTEKAFPEDEAVITTRVAAEGPAATSNVVVYERRLGPRNQLELKLPFGWEDRPGGAAGSTSGVGDLTLGFKRALSHSVERGRILSLAGEVKLPTGDEARGFGAGTTLVEGFVAFGQALPADSFLQLQAGAEGPLDRGAEADDEAFARLALGRSFAPRRFGRVWTPMLEVLAARELVSGADTHWDAVPQLQVTLSTRQHVLASLGVRLPLDDPGGRQSELVAYLLWDWFDGGLLDGW
jgi:hypothetical protein